MSRLIKVDDLPDFQHWKSVEEFTLEQAALLMAGIDPLEVRLDEVVNAKTHARWKLAAAGILTLTSAVRQGVLTLIRCVTLVKESEFSDGDYLLDIKQTDREHDLYLPACIVSRVTLFDWIERKKIIYVISAKNTETPQTEIQDIKLIANDYHGHKSDGLDYVDMAIKQLWSTFDIDDPNTAPTQKEVMDYLLKQGATQNMAKAVNLILRPRDLPKRTQIKRHGDT